ncbi:PilW family protein [Microbulbifer sp. OS29]|uniref:PilW family protein n=1 Tax=Microbulbifer okhotskensis TaxID=2926617 RepID=A0A9X2J6P3_9GAMM|nr:PilW family protein [Microbulbifer okhotskensis]MCO1334830.1 PilW family protein [Microbulbifer okhotskensis]
MKTLSSNKGLSLIELLIGLLLSSLLLLGVLQIFQSNSDAIRMQNAFSRVQESGRFAMDMLSREVRQAGYWGCVADQSKITNRLNTASSVGSEGVMGQDNVPAGTTVDGKTVAENSDILILSGAKDPCGGAGRLIAPSASGELQIQASCPVVTGAVVLVANCEDGDVFAVTELTGDEDAEVHVVKHTTDDIVGSSVKNSSAELNAIYGVEAQILSPYQKTFFISDGSLFVEDQDKRSWELVPGVEDMQITYGRDTTGSGIIDTWGAASSSDTVMAQVVGVRLELSIQSDTDAGATTDDGRLRKLYVSTVKVRNRGSM